MLFLRLRPLLVSLCPLRANSPWDGCSYVLKRISYQIIYGLKAISYQNSYGPKAMIQLSLIKA